MELEVICISGVRPKAGCVWQVWLSGVVGRCVANGWCVAKGRVVGWWLVKGRPKAGWWAGGLSKAGRLLHIV